MTDSAVFIMVKLIWAKPLPATRGKEGLEREKEKFIETDGGMGNGVNAAKSMVSLVLVPWLG